MGEFAVLSVLEIFDTAGSRPQMSAEEANAAATYDVIRNSINLALTGFGQWVTEAGITRGNLGLVLVGQAISLATFIADYVMDKLGIYEWLERKFGFFPEDVTAVWQDIRKLMREYRVILGGVELGQRSDESLRALGAKSPAAVREAARLAATARRSEAHEKELELVSAFEEAYRTARKSFAGLRELDQWRNEFFALQAQAEAGAASGNQRAAIESRFLAIESGVTLDQEDEKSIRDLKQWDKIRDAIKDVNDALARVEAQQTDPNFTTAGWESVQKKEHELTMMLNNARYRLDPQAQGPYRTTALLSKGTAARGFYEKELDSVEKEAAFAMSRLATAARTLRLPTGYVMKYPMPAMIAGVPAVPITAEMMLQHVDQALVSYRTAIQATSLPFGTLPEGLASSSAVGAAYLSSLQTLPAFAASLYRLQADEDALRMLLGKAAAMIHEEPLLTAVKRRQEEFEDAIDQRKVVKMLLFPTEVPEQLETSQAGERRRFAETLGQGKQVKPLSEYEYAALETGVLLGAAPTLGDVESQLRQIPPGAKLYRFQGRKDQLPSIGVADVPGSVDTHWPPPTATLAMNVIVAQVGDAPSHGTSYAKIEYVYILPVNRAAIEFFGTRGKVPIMKDGHEFDVPYEPGKGP
jgi:hypothetical protein